MNNFFLSLAERKHNENDLSDITYALCKANDEFRKFWLKYCFEDDIDTEDLVREYQDGFSRPDFFFHDLNNQERIIEVKIYDWNQHFEQYEEYFGGREQVKKMIDECPYCGSKLVHSHLPDYQNLIIQETSRCPECGNGRKKIIHILN